MTAPRVHGSPCAALRRCRPPTSLQSPAQTSHRWDSDKHRRVTEHAHTHTHILQMLYAEGVSCACDRLVNRRVLVTRDDGEDRVFADGTWDRLSEDLPVGTRDGGFHCVSRFLRDVETVIGSDYRGRRRDFAVRHFFFYGSLF